MRRHPTQDTATIGTAASSGTTDPLPKFQTGVTRPILSITIGRLGYPTRLR
jgi:hypothetical protein